MQLKELLLKGQSKEKTIQIVNWIGSDQKRFDELFALFTGDDPLLVQRAAWPLSYAVIAHPPLINKHWKKLLQQLQQPGIHDAVKRNGIRLMEGLAIPEKFHGDVMNRCFDFITDPKEKPAIKAFSLTVLHNLSKQYPEIKNELKVVIESQWENESAGFRSRARKIINNNH